MLQQRRAAISSSVSVRCGDAMAAAAHAEHKKFVHLPRKIGNARLLAVAAAPSSSEATHAPTAPKSLPHEQHTSATQRVTPSSIRSVIYRKVPLVTQDRLQLCCPATNTIRTEYNKSNLTQTTACHAKAPHTRTVTLPSTTPAGPARHLQCTHVVTSGPLVPFTTVIDH